MFVEMCIFSGCDYLPSIPGLGIKRSHALISKQKCYKKALRCIKFEGKYKIPENYADDFEKAKLTFTHQRVYDIGQKKLVPLRKLPETLIGAKLDYLGPDLDQEIAQGIAEGKLNPVTKEVFREKTEVEAKYKKNQHVLKSFKGRKRRKNQPPPQKNNLFSFFSKKKQKAVLETETPNLVNLMGGVKAVNEAFPNEQPIRVQKSLSSFNPSHFSSARQESKTGSKSTVPRKKFRPEPTADYFDEENVGSIKGGLPEMPEELVSKLKIERKPKPVPRRSKFFKKKRKSLDRAVIGEVQVRKRQKSFKPPRFVKGEVPSELGSVSQEAGNQKDTFSNRFINKENEAKAHALLKFMGQDVDYSPPPSTPSLLPPKERISTHHLKPFVPPKRLCEKPLMLERFSCG